MPGYVYFTEEQKQLDAQLKEVSSVSRAAGEKLRELRAQIDGLNQTAEQSKNEIISLLNERASTKGRLQRYDAMQEQAQLRKSELTQKLLEARTSEETQRASFEKYQKELMEVSSRILELTASQKEKEEEAEGFRRQLGKLNEELEVGQSAYHR